jgi:hypothetical protein
MKKQVELKRYMRFNQQEKYIDELKKTGANVGQNWECTKH